VPCISTPVNGIPELICHGHSGLLATPGDAVSLATQLRRVITDGALRRRLSLAARAQVDTTFQLSRNVRRLASILGGLPAVRSAGAVS
jgi:colanic acid/amylovoran biosynthesis glycosyltransferase